MDTDNLYKSSSVQSGRWVRPSMEHLYEEASKELLGIDLKASPGAMQRQVAAVYFQRVSPQKIGTVPNDLGINIE